MVSLDKHATKLYSEIYRFTMKEDGSPCSAKGKSSTTGLNYTQRSEFDDLNPSKEV